jgi:hypothetical protein
MTRLLASAALMALISGSTSAEVFKVGDLGEMPSRRVCLATASAVLEAYIDEFGGRAANGETDIEDSWSVYGWDLRPGDVDVVITCPVVTNQVNAFYTLYSSGSTEIEDTETAAARIRELWERLF